MTEEERLAFNMKMAVDRENGYVTVWWRIVRNAHGEVIEGAGTSGWGWGHKTFDPKDFEWMHLQYHMTVGHGRDYDHCKPQWDKMKRTFIEAQIDGTTFGPSAAMQRIYTAIREFIYKEPKPNKDNTPGFKE